MTKRILHVVSNVANYADQAEPTGLWLSELIIIERPPGRPKEGGGQGLQLRCDAQPTRSGG